MSLKFCANLSFMFQETASLLDRYALAKKCGFNAVECAFPYEYSINEIQSVQQKEGLEQILINVYPGNLTEKELGFAALPDKQNEFRRSLHLAVSYAKALNCRMIHIQSGIVDSPTAEHENMFRSNLVYATNVLQKEQLVGLLEPISPFAVPNYFLNSFEKAALFIREINSPHLKLQIDLFHLQLLKGNITGNLRQYLPITGHIQVAQVPGRHEPDTDGEINFCYVFELLKQLNYTGWIGCEYKPANDTESGLKWRKMLDF